MLARASSRSPRSWSPKSWSLVAVASQHLDDLRRFRDGEHVGAAEVSLPLARQPHLQMARAGAAMLHLASGGDTETLLDALVGLLLWHD